MTTPLSQQQDDSDSLYDHPLPETKRARPANDIILPKQHAIHVDSLLDSEETPPPSSTNSAVQTLSDDDVFDSDENKISTSSSSSSTTASQRLSSDNIPVVSLDSPTHSKPSPSFLSRASATFYKAFRKKPLRPTPAPPPSASSQITNDAHVTLAQLFDAQIATLRSARTGFVDLALVTPMTRRTLQAINDAQHMLSTFGQLQHNVTTLRHQHENATRETEADIVAKERLLIEAKLSLAQVSEEVDTLRHELSRLQKLLADPNRVDRRKAARVRRDALVCREARRDVERRLSDKRLDLQSETAKLQSVEKQYRDIEGDWA